MNDVVPTVKIKTANGPVEINLSDFVPGTHELADAADLPPLQPVAEPQVDPLYGSSIQPATWTLDNGDVLQLGTVVAEAHARSGLSVAEWNALPQEIREEKIAEVVNEIVPTPDVVINLSDTVTGE